MLTLKTIKSGDPEEADIDIDKDYDGYYVLKQDHDWIVLTRKAVQELGQYLVNLDLDR